MRKTILCLGEILLRLSPPGHELLLQTPQLRASIAGAVAIVAVALASFGHLARMLSVLPELAIAQAAVAELRRHGVDTSAIATGEGRMGLFYLVPGAVRRPSRVEYDRRDSAFVRAPALADPKPWLSAAQWFHISGITPALGRNCADFAIEAAASAQQADVQVSFDGNYRSKLWQGREQETPAILRAMLENTNVLFGDERDLSLALGKSFNGATPFDRSRHAIDEAFRTFPKLHTVAFSTRAQLASNHQTYGADMFTRDTHCQIAPVDLAGIVDRIGTGDAFAAGIIHGKLMEMASQQTLAFGHAAACLKHSIPGDFLPCDAGTVSALIGNEALDVKR